MYRAGYPYIKELTYNQGVWQLIDTTYNIVSPNGLVNATRCKDGKVYVVSDSGLTVLETGDNE